MTFYETLVECMDARGMTFPELCDRTGFYPSYFSKLKNGHARDVTWERAIAIISALGMTPLEFLEVQRSK